MKGAFSLFWGNLASKASGAIRELLFASLFGASNTAAAFRISQTSFYAPTHALVVETVGASFVPSYKEGQRDSDAQAQALLIVAGVCAFLLSVIIGVVLFFFAAKIVSVVAPGANGDAKLLAQLMLAICALAVPFYVVGNFIGYLEVAHGRYAPIASRSTVLNILSILGALVAAFFHAPLYLVAGIVAGHIGFFIWTFAIAARRGFLRWWFPKGHGIYWNALKKFVLRAGPLVVLPFLAQGNAVVERIVGSFLGTEVIPCIDYARFITDTMLTLFAVPVGVATMATYGGLRTEETIEHVSKISIQLAIIVFPLSAFLVCNASDVVQLLFSRGAFDTIAAQNTTQIVKGLGIGLGATTVAYYFQMALNAQLRNVESVLTVCAAVGANIVINLLFWRQFGPFALGIGATAYGVTQYIAGLLRLRLVRRQARPLLWIIGGCGCYVVLYRVMPQFDLLPLRLTMQAIGAAIMWTGLIYISPSLQTVAAPFLYFVRKRLGRAFRPT